MDNNYAIRKAIFNFRDRRYMTIGFVAATGLTLVGLVGGLENAVTYQIENKDLMFYLSETSKGLGIGLLGASIFYTGLRGIDYLFNPNIQGWMDLAVKRTDVK